LLTKEEKAWNFLLCGEQSKINELIFLIVCKNPQLGWGFRKAFSFEPVIKTPFDLLKQFAVWQLRTFNKKSKGGPYEGRKELSAHALEL
jgi:hypothetical protein